ncbi:MAG: GvpL/GvpF family gas vesicle protein [Alphaproteobacteria bacterium]
MMDQTVYGLTTLEGATRLTERKTRVEGRRIRPVIAGGLAAVVGPTPRGRPWQTRQHRALHRLRVYQTVLETVMAVMPILPARFETRMASPERIRTFLDSCGRDLRQPLDQYGSLIQFEVMVSWSVVDAIEQLRADGLIGLKFGQGREHDLETARALKAAVEGHRCGLTERIRTMLAAVSLDVIETPRMEETVVANFTCLLRRADELSLDAALKAFDRETGGRLKIRCIGPLPACSFAAVEVEEADFRTVDAARRRLRLAETVTMEDLKRAYRRAVKHLHPDTNPGGEAVSEDMARLRDAYNLLCRVADGQLRRPIVAPTTDQPAVHFNAPTVQRSFSVRLRRVGDETAEAA